MVAWLSVVTTHGHSSSIAPSAQTETISPGAGASPASIEDAAPAVLAALADLVLSNLAQVQVDLR